MKSKVELVVILMVVFLARTTGSRALGKCIGGDETEKKSESSQRKKTQVMRNRLLWKHGSLFRHSYKEMVDLNVTVLNVFPKTKDMTGFRPPLYLKKEIENTWG